LQTYTVTIKRTGGSRIVNFNATTRVGATSTVAGSFTAVTNSALYSGADGGMYATPHSIDSAVFRWTAPAGGTGTVNFYAAAFQGTTSSANGQSSKVTLSASEITTRVEGQTSAPAKFELGQNFPNPFNPTTEISFTAGSTTFVTLKVFNLVGQEVTTLVNGDVNAGEHTITLNAKGLPSGIYFYQLASKNSVETKKMILAK
jgi:hypothetical protein